MKQIVGILFLLITLKLTSSGQSRILTGTLTAAPNTSTTILPHIVQTKNSDAQKEDSALFNPRYVPPPPVDSSALNTNQATVQNSNNYSQVQNVKVEESTYQYKTPDSQPYVDGNRGNGSNQQYSSYQPSQKVIDAGADTYQYKTPDSQPFVDNRTRLSGSHYPKRVATKASNTSEILDKNGFVTNPSSLASSQDYGNAGANVAPKWTPKKTWKRDTITIDQTKSESKAGVRSSITPTLTVRNSGLTPTLTLTPSANVVIPPKANTTVASVPTYTTRNKTRKKSATIVSLDNSINSNQAQQVSASNADYKLNVTPDGKYTLTFFNNGGTVTVTEFGRILSVTSPTSGGTTPQYDYRGLLESVGNLPLQYTYEGRLLSVGSTVLGYNYNGNIQSIGNTSLYYNSNGTLDKVGNTKVQYDANGSVSSTSDANPIIALKQW